MPNRLLLLLAALLVPVPAWAQPELPVVRAGSRLVTIVDGPHVMKNIWYVMPEKSPDVYYVEIPRRPHTVTFTTDRESIAFDVSFGSVHRFIVRLEDGREGLTEIRTEFKTGPVMSRAAGASPGPPSIPFTLGDNDKIYVDGRLNGGAPLRLQVDFGAGGTIVKKASVPKANLTFDATITLRNSDGVNVVPASSTNELVVHDLRWRGVHVAQADNMTWREDGIVGNLLFRDKVVEVDYDRMRLTVHDALPDLPAGAWTREEVFLDGGTVPFIRGRLAVGGAVRDGWFMLDTGAYTSILHSDLLSPSAKFRQELRGLVGAGKGPILHVAGRTFAGTNYSVRLFDGDVSSLGLLGSDVLKRFNWILDNQQGAAYFRPSVRMADPWRNPERLVVRAAAVSTPLLAVAAAWLVRRRRRRL